MADETAVQPVKKIAGWGLLLILLIYGLLAGAHSVIVPLTTGNDEWAHFLYVRFIAVEGHLPATWPEREEAGYKSDAPPLYHLLVAEATSGVEPTALLRRLNSPRRELADNKANPYAIVHTAVEFFPYRGEVLLWHLGRALSVLFGLALIVVTYLTAWELNPDPPVALTAAAFAAFIPAFIFHSSVLSYESLSATLTALFLWVGIKAIKQPRRWGWWLLLGVLAGLSVATKYSAVLLPLEIILIVWLARRAPVGGEAHGQATTRPGLIPPLVMAGAAVILASGWWFGFVAWHFNTIETQGPLIGTLQPLLVGDASDTTSVQVAGFFFGETADLDTRPPLTRNYLQLTQSFIESFWAAPVEGAFFFSPWLPLLFTLVALFGLAGLWKVWQRADPLARTWLILLTFHTLLISPLLLMRILLSFDPREAAQGRHFLLPAISAIAILLIWGWHKWQPRLGQAVVVGLLLWSLLGQVGWAAVTYDVPLTVWPDTVPAPIKQPETARSLLNSLELLEATWDVEAETLAVTLWWRTLKTMPEDYLVELTLFDAERKVVGYALGHPLRGRYPTRAWELGDVVKDEYWLILKDHVSGNYTLQLRLLNRLAQPLAEETAILLGEVALTTSSKTPDPCTIWFRGRSQGLLSKAYPVRSGLTVIGTASPRLQRVQPEQEDRFPLMSVADIHTFIVEPTWADAYRLLVGETDCGLLSFDIPRRNFTRPEIPVPLVVNFNNEIQLLGYDLPTRHIQPGQRLPLTLYWQGVAYMGEDYRMFDNLLDQEQQRRGGYDRRAKDGYSTLLWVPGEVITDAFGVPVDPDAPPGVYTLDLGWYRETVQGIESLPLMVDGQATESTSVRLGPIKVGGPPADVVTTNPRPQFELDQAFGEEITLLGYDLADDMTQPGSTLDLTFYWRAKAVPAADYTLFLHLRDAANQTMAQKDAPPMQGRYPTSLWDAGEIIVDHFSLSLDDVPPGRYVPTVGLYNFATGDRLPVPGHLVNEISLQPVEIR